MKELAAEFRAAVRREMGSRVRRGQRYPEDLRSMAVACWRKASESGGGLSEAAAALGVRPLTLKRWADRERSRFRPVEIVPDETSPVPVTLVTPEGLRLECSSVEVAASLVRALG